MLSVGQRNIPNHAPHEKVKQYRGIVAIFVETVYFFLWFPLRFERGVPSDICWYLRVVSERDGTGARTTAWRGLGYELGCVKLRAVGRHEHGTVRAVARAYCGASGERGSVE